MALDLKKPASNGKPLTPKAPIRSRSTPYFTPKLAATTGITPSPELRRDGRGVATFTATKSTDGSNMTPPVKTMLTANITPRSSSRKSRAGSVTSTPNSTPNGTPANSRPISVTTPPRSKQGTDISPKTNAISRRRSKSLISNGVSDSQSAQSTGIQGHIGAYTPSPMFFRANETIFAPQRPAMTKSVSGFVYADGRQENSAVRQQPAVAKKTRSQLGSQTSLYSLPGRPGSSPKRDTLTDNISPATSPKLPAPVISPRLGQTRQRSTSPLKDFETPGQFSGPNTRRTSGASNLSLQSMVRSTVVSQFGKAAPIAKPIDNWTHVKTPSMSMLEASLRPKSIDTQPNVFVPIANASLASHDRQGSQDLSSTQLSHQEPFSAPTSPLVSTNQAVPLSGENKIAELNMMAASARRERKVLDLEISNSSLLAINRTLEREMRKQKAELRRFRRLTSAGRISIAPTERSVSGATTISTLSALSIDTGFDSDSDQEGSLTDIPSDEEESESSDNSALSLSPKAEAARAAQKRIKDEKRLQLDLSKHQQILLDSQKMNESLKRCLGWTDELILEGKKALAYQVARNEVPIGGRVLHDDDNPAFHDATPRLGLLSPTRVYMDADELLWSSGMLPRNAGVEQDKEQSLTVADEIQDLEKSLSNMMITATAVHGS